MTEQTIQNLYKNIQDTLPGSQKHTIMDNQDQEPENNK